MKYLCMGYHDAKAWEAMTDGQRKAIQDESVAWGELLRKNGHCSGATGLRESVSAATLRFESSGAMSITDGPFAETKEQLGGVMVLEATDLNHAITLMSQMPCMRFGGSLEIRPINEELTF